MRCVGAALVAILLLLAGSVHGQVGSSTDILTGVVTDENGTPLAGAIIEAMSLETQIVRRRAQWSDGWLVVSREIDGGGKITETYLRSNDGRRLYVVVQLALPRVGSGRGRDEGKSRPIEFRRVYDPVTTSS